MDLYNPAAAEPVPAAREFVQEMLHGHQAAREAAEYASSKQKEQYDRRRSKVPFKQNDYVWLSSEHCKFQGRTDKLTKRFLGPYKIVSMPENGLTATLPLPKGVKIHPTVHINRLKRFKGRTTASGEPKDAPSGDFDVEDEQADDVDRQHQDLQISNRCSSRRGELEAASPSTQARVPSCLERA